MDLLTEAIHHVREIPVFQAIDIVLRKHVDMDVEAKEPLLSRDEKEQLKEYMFNYIKNKRSR